MLNELEMERLRESLSDSGKVYEAALGMTLYSLIGDTAVSFDVSKGTPLIAMQADIRAPWQDDYPYTVMLASPKNKEQEMLCGVNIPAGALRPAGPLTSLAAQGDKE